MEILKIDINENPRHTLDAGRSVPVPRPLQVHANCKSTSKGKEVRGARAPLQPTQDRNNTANRMKTTPGLKNKSAAARKTNAESRTVVNQQRVGAREVAEMTGAMASVNLSDPIYSEPGGSSSVKTALLTAAPSRTSESPQVTPEVTMAARSSRRYRVDKIGVQA